MKKLVFKGTVERGDAYRVGDDEPGAIRIGGRDVVEEVAETFTEKTNLTVGVADERFDGDLFIETGWGYSEWTPMDSDELKIGDHNLLEILGRYEGERVTVFLSDGPIDLMDVLNAEESSNPARQ